MEFPLPPQDPNEDLDGSRPLLHLHGPTMCFPMGAPDLETERLAGELLDHRPGALIVFPPRR